MNNILYNKTSQKEIRHKLRNNMPALEVVVWSKLKGKQLDGLKFRRQYSVGKYILDFYCPLKRLAIEIDGDSHYSSEGRQHDGIRHNFLSAKNIQVIRFTNKEILNNLDGVLLKIVKATNTTPIFQISPPKLGGDGGGIKRNKDAICCADGASL